MLVVFHLPQTMVLVKIKFSLEFQIMSSNHLIFFVCFIVIRFVVVNCVTTQLMNFRRKLALLNLSLIFSASFLKIWSYLFSTVKFTKYSVTYVMLRNFRFLTLFSMYRCNNFIVGTSAVGVELECVCLSILPSFFALKSGVRGPCGVMHDICPKNLENGLKLGFFKFIGKFSLFKYNQIAGILNQLSL